KHMLANVIDVRTEVREIPLDDQFVVDLAAKVAQVVISEIGVLSETCDPREDARGPADKLVVVREELDVLPTGQGAGRDRLKPGVLEEKGGVPLHRPNYFICQQPIGDELAQGAAQVLPAEMHAVTGVSLHGLQLIVVPVAPRKPQWRHAAERL